MTSGWVYQPLNATAHRALASTNFRNTAVQIGKGLLLSKSTKMATASLQMLWDLDWEAANVGTRERNLGRDGCLTRICCWGLQPRAAPWRGTPGPGGFRAGRTLQHTRGAAQLPGRPDGVERRKGGRRGFPSRRRTGEGGSRLPGSSRSPSQRRRLGLPSGRPPGPPLPRAPIWPAGEAASPARKTEALALCRWNCRYSRMSSFSRRVSRGAAGRGSPGSSSAAKTSARTRARSCSSAPRRASASFRAARRQSARRSTGRSQRGPPPPSQRPRPPRPADGTTNRRAAVTRFQLGDGRHLGRGGAGNPRETGTATPGATEARPSPPLARTRPIAARADSAAAAEGGMLSQCALARWRAPSGGDARALRAHARRCPYGNRGPGLLGRRERRGAAHPADRCRALPRQAKRLPTGPSGPSLQGRGRPRSASRSGVRGRSRAGGGLRVLGQWGGRAGAAGEEARPGKPREETRRGERGFPRPPPTCRASLPPLRARRAQSAPAPGAAAPPPSCPPPTVCCAASGSELAGSNPRGRLAAPAARPPPPWAPPGSATAPPAPRPSG